MNSNIFSLKKINNDLFFQHIVDCLEESILVIDKNKNIIYKNKTLHNKFKLKNNVMENNPKCHEVFSEAPFSCSNEINQCPYDDALKTKKTVSIIHQYKNPEDNQAYYELSISPLMDEQKNIYGFIESRRDISPHIQLQNALKEKEQYLEDLAHKDPLTNIANRRKFSELLEKAIEKSKHKNIKLAVLFIDLDNFKQINDSLGHQIGDEVLKISSQRIQNNIRKHDTIARLGGDEFIILMNSIQDEKNATILAEKIIASQKKLIKVDEHEFYVKSSIGISIYPNDGKTAEQLIQNADMAMYRSKQLGKNTYHYYSLEMTTIIQQQQKMEQELSQAIEKGQLLVHYQPQVDLQSGKLSGMAALIRWNHPINGMIMPDKFIPIAEKSYLIEELGTWVLTTVCQQIVEWKNKQKDPGRVAVNLSCKQVINESLADKIIGILNQTNCPADSLELKITEGFLSQLSDSSIHNLNRLREMGIEISIDDFGKGYSSLAFLKDLPISRLKIDKYFIQNSDDNPNNEEIAKAIIALGKSLKLRVLAEGVEKKSQQQLLSRVGCNEAQGYLFAKPMDGKSMSDFLGQNNNLLMSKT